MTILNPKIQPRLEKYLLPAILIIAGFLRLYQLDRNSLWYDEIFQVLIARGTLLETVFPTVSNAGGSPLDYVVTHFTYHLLGTSEGMLRLLPVLWGILCVVVVFYLARKMFDSPTAYLAATLVAILPIHIYFSREVRYYILPVLLVLLGTYLLIRAVETNTRKGWLTYAVVMTLAFLAQIYALSPAAMHGLWLLLFHRNKRTWTHYLTACLLMALLYGPWLVYFVSSGSQNTTWEASPPAFATVIGNLLMDLWPAGRVLNNTPPSEFVRQVLDRYLMIFVGTIFLYGGLLALGVIQIIRDRLKSPRTRYFALLYFVFVGGVGGIVLFDHLTGYPFAARQLVLYSPFLVLLCSAIYATTIPARLQQKTWLTSIIIAVMVVVNLIMFLRPLSDMYNSSRENWRSLGRYLLQHVQSDDVVLATQPAHFSFYTPELAAQITDAFPASQAEMDALLETHDRIWITRINWEVDLELLYSHPFMREWLEGTNPQTIILDDVNEDFIIYVYPALEE